MCAVVSRGICHRYTTPRKTEGQYLSEPNSEVLKEPSIIRAYAYFTYCTYMHIVYICMQYTCNFFINIQRFDLLTDMSNHYIQYNYFISEYACPLQILYLAHVRVAWSLNTLPHMYVCLHTLYLQNTSL